MAFEVFRRHQKKLLAIFGILAMFGFVVSDSLPRLLSSSAAGRDQSVVKLYGKTIYQSDLQEMVAERSTANQFVSRLSPFAGPTPFGGYKNREIVDALILQHEADKLGLPAGPSLGKEFLRQITQGRPQGPMSGEEFDARMAEFNNRVSGEQVLSAIANQVRLANIRRLVGAPMVTPYDVFRAYRDENEKVAAKLVEVPVSKFLPQVKEPTDEQVRAYYEKYKDVLPDPARPTPGFKIPRQIQVEVLSLDGNALSRTLKDRLTDAELRSAYENRKSEFEVRPGPGDLPTDLFAGAPELTPPAVRPFDEVRSILASSLAEERAQAEIEEKFDRIKANVLDKFSDEYQDALEAQEQAKKEGEKAVPPLPEPGDLKDLAKRENLTYEQSPMLSREDAEHFGQLGEAQVGLTRLGDGKKFVEEFFDPKTPMYESVGLSDMLGRRYLVRKVKDAAPRIPPLDEVRPQVALAWKMEQARPLARKAAEGLAEPLKKQPPKDATYQGYPVATIPAIARKFAPFSLSSNPYRMADPEETPIREVPLAGEAFRKAYFGLQPGAVAVAPDRPETTYYVMTLDRREPASFAALYAPAGDEYRYKAYAREQADRQLIDNWMGWLRRQAGVPADWVPSDEAKEKEQATGRG